MSLRNEVGNFCMREYGQDTDYSNENKVPIAATNIGDQEQHDVEVFVDMGLYRILMEIDGKQTDVWQYESEDQLAKQISRITFPQLVQLGPEAEKIVNM